MTIETLTADIHAKTGFTGAQLEAAVFMFAMKMAEKARNKAAEEHFSAKFVAAMRRTA